MFKYFFLFIGCLFTFGCVTTQEVTNLNSELNSLKQKINHNKQQTQKKISRLQEKVDKLQEKTFPVKSTQANLWSEIKDQKRELARIKGNQEKISFDINKFKHEFGNHTQEISMLQKQTKMQELKLNQIISSLGLEIDVISNSNKKTTQLTTSNTSVSNQAKEKSTPEQLYEQALAAFSNKKYQKALDLWGEYTQNYPGKELVSNSYFWQGECFYQMQDYAQAVLSYQEVIENYPNSNKYPAALLKQGLSFYKLDKKKAGRILLQELTDKFPHSAESRRAKKFLNSHGQ